MRQGEATGFHPLPSHPGQARAGGTCGREGVPEASGGLPRVPDGSGFAWGQTSGGRLFMLRVYLSLSGVPWSQGLTRMIIPKIATKIPIQPPMVKLKAKYIIMPIKRRAAPATTRIDFIFLHNHF